MLSVWSIIIYHPWFMYDLLIYDRMILMLQQITLILCCSKSPESLTTIWRPPWARENMHQGLHWHQLAAMCQKGSQTVPEELSESNGEYGMTTFVTTHCIAHYWLLASDLWAVARWYSAQLVAPASIICWWPFHSRCPRFQFTLVFITSVSFMGC